MNESLRQKRRGAPVPLTDDQLTPPRFFSEAQRAAWQEAISTRPGYWCSGDLRLLEVWAVAAAYLREAHAAMARGDNAPEVSPRAYKNALRAMLDAGRALRLTAFDRAAAGSAVHSPPLDSSAATDAPSPSADTPPWHAVRVPPRGAGHA